MATIYTKVAIADSLPIAIDFPHPLSKVVFLDNCDIPHLLGSKILKMNKQELLDQGYEFWLKPNVLPPAETLLTVFADKEGLSESDKSANRGFRHAVEWIYAWIKGEAHG